MELLLLLLAILAICATIPFLGFIGLSRPVDKKRLRSGGGIRGPRWRLPPGPQGLPIVGNLLQFFQARDSGRLVPWLEGLSKHGEMTTLHMGSKTWVVLNSDRVASDIILKFGRITSERPYMPIASGLVSNEKRTVLRQTTEWQEGRRVMHHLLSGSSLRTYGDWYATESIRLIASYLHQPKTWAAHHYRYATMVLCRLVFGASSCVKTKTELDTYQRVAMEFVASINRHFVDFFPWLADLVPTGLQFWAPKWRAMGRFHRNVFVAWWDPVVAEIDAGTAPPSFTRDTLLHPDTKYRGSREEAMYLATSITAAGGDNTRMTMNTFVMAMISYPKALKRLQAELDACCGRTTTTTVTTATATTTPNKDSHSLRLPTFSDLSSLPFCAATIKEVLRWRPTVPLVPQHQLTEPLEYDGYHFPTGTEFLMNNIALRNSGWEEPDKFRPERYIDGTESNPIHRFWGFGGGRRICAGYRVAQQSLFIAYARIAYCFDIVADGPYDDRQLNHQSLDEPFPVKIVPRSEAHRRLILAEEEKLNTVGLNGNGGGKSPVN